MFELMSSCTDAGLKSLSPVINGLIKDDLSEVRPYLNQTLFQFIDVAYSLLIYSILKTAPNFIVDWI